MKSHISKANMFCLAIAMFTSESAWYIPCGFLGLALLCLYLEMRLRR